MVRDAAQAGGGVLPEWPIISPTRKSNGKGPAIANAFDAAGEPTRAALGFAASCGVAVDQLQQVDGPKARYCSLSGEAGRGNLGTVTRHRNNGLECASHRETDALGRG